MYLRVPEVGKCCFCFPLRYGIMILGIVNIFFSLVAVASLVITTEIRKSMSSSTSFEEVTSTILYSILGMGVILNIILLVGGFQKDISMLRLYNYYAVLTTLVALVALIVLFSRQQYVDVCAASVAIVMQIYVIVLVRSETLKLEKKLLAADEAQVKDTDVGVDVPDNITLL